MAKLMDPIPLLSGPKVFISFGGPDRTQAERLVKDLDAHGIRTFFAPHDVQGRNFVLTISQALRDSDYFVLLVSATSSTRPWVDEEWSAAFAREVNERRAFLFVVRLDETPPPTFLGARDYFDLFIDWQSQVNRLIGIWQRDWNTTRNGTHVFPAPRLPLIPEKETIGIYIFNQAFAVQHFTRVPLPLSGRQLYAHIRWSLKLEDQVSAIEGKVGLSFKYLLFYKEAPLPDDIGITEAGIKDGASLDLRVTVEPFGLGEPGQRVEFRAGQDSAQLHQPLIRELLSQAFGHLRP